MDATEYLWTVPVDHPAFAGHFPARPIVPGVVLLDQALRFAAQWSGVADTAGWQVAQAKFFVPVGPGAVLRFKLEPAARGGMVFRVDCDGRDVASGSLMPPAP